MRDAHEILRLRHVVVPGLAEMARINARREGMDIRMPLALRLEEAETACEDHIGYTHQFLLQRNQRRRRALEAAELIHAIIDTQTTGDMRLIGNAMGV